MKKRYLVPGLLCALALSLAPQTVMTTNAAKSSVTSESIKQKQEQIKQAEKEKKALQDSLSDLKNIKKELEKEKTDLKNYVQKLDANLDEIEKNIAGLNVQISEKETEIARTETELAAAQEKETVQKDAMVSRIRTAYENGTPHMVELFAQSEDFGDFLNNADYISKVVAYDRLMWEEYKANRELVELCKAQLELDKQILSQAKVNVETEQANLENLIQQKNKDITKYESDISTKEQAIKEYEAEIAAQDAEIAAWEKQIAEEKKKLQGSGSAITYDGGMFKFPLASYTRISDDYGNRIHPTLGVQQFHNGVDFAAPKGTAIYAAYDGKVVAATYSATMGNYVMIDHGDELYTIYMHASALYVSAGDTVARGDHIAAVGSTGRSTGNHLHFSVRLNGAYQSPWNYLSK